MGIAFGALTSLFLGAADFFGGRSSRSASSATVVAFGTAVALPLVFLALAVVPSVFTSADLWLGAASGLIAGVALAGLYLGFARFGTSSVAPAAAVVAAIVPLIIDLLNGASITKLALVGVIVGVCGLYLTTFTPGAPVKVVGVAWAALCGIGFGIGFAILSLASDTGGVWPLAGQRVGVMIAAAALTLRAGHDWAPVRSPGPVRFGSIASGVLSVVGIAFLIAGLRRGDLGLVGLASSQFPAVTVVLMALFGGERLRWWHSVGVAMAVLAISLISVG